MSVDGHQALLIHSVFDSIGQDRWEKAKRFYFVTYSVCCSSYQPWSPPLLSLLLFVWEWLKGESILSLTKRVSRLIKLWEHIVTTGKHNAHRQLLQCGSCGNSAPRLLEFAQDWETLDRQIRSAAAWFWENARVDFWSSAGHEAKEMVDHRFGPPAACLRRPDVCHRQMMGKRSCGWRALGNEQENERRDCLRPLVLTGLPFSGICSITAVCVEATLNGPTDSRDTQKGKQAFSLWLRSANCAQNSRRLNARHETTERFGVNDVGVTL